MEINQSDDKLYELIKKAVREVIKEEKMNFVLQNTEPVSKEEMQDIIELYGKPSPLSDIDRTEEIDI